MSHTVRGGHVVRCQTCDREVAGSRSRVVRIPPAAAVHQCQLSTPSLRGRLMSTNRSWE